MDRASVFTLAFTALLAPGVVAADEQPPLCESSAGECTVLSYEELPAEVTVTEIEVVPIDESTSLLTTLSYEDGRTLTASWQMSPGSCSARTACESGARIECERGGRSACGKRGWFVHCGSVRPDGALEGVVKTCKGRSERPEPPDPSPPPSDDGDDDEEEPEADEEEAPPPHEEDPPADEEPPAEDHVYHCHMDIVDDVLGPLTFCTEYDAARIGQQPTPQMIRMSADVCGQAGGAWRQGRCDPGWRQSCTTPKGVAHFYYQYTEGAPETQCQRWKGVLETGSP